MIGKSRTVARRAEAKSGGALRIGPALLLLGVAAAAASYAWQDSHGSAKVQTAALPAGGGEREFRDAPAVIEPSAEPGAELGKAVIDDLLRDPDRDDLAPAHIAAPRVAALTPGPPPLSPSSSPWLVNAVPFQDRPGLKLVAVIIDDAGLDRARTARAAQLPGPLTISFLPYAGELQRQAGEARGRGHELMLHVPMEPISAGEDPGPHPLLTWLGRDEAQRRLLLMLQRFDGFVGVNNHMGSRMTQDAQAMLPVLEQLRARGLLFVDSRTSAGSVAGPLADRLGIPGTARDVFIDHDGNAEAVAQRLADIERIARRQGQAVAIGHPHDLTLGALERWLPSLAERGFTLAPVSALAKRRWAERRQIAAPAAAGQGG
jgi:polysaccharide deacetylase 2 family uncharacterized protein YibQ